MTKSVVAERYANAMFELAQQKNEAELVQQQLKEVKKAFYADKGLRNLLESPALSNDKKKEIVGSILQGANKTVIDSIRVLLDNNRMNEFANVVEAFNALANDAQGVAEATVYSTRELTEEERTSISNAFASKVGKQSLIIENVIEPKLIGGIRLQIGNHIYDSSVQAKLKRLEREMLG